MTLVVLTKDGIYADRRLTLKVPVRDQDGKEVLIKGTTDDYRKIGSSDLRDKYNCEIDAYAVFGDIDTANALLKYLSVVGLGNLDAAMAALCGFKIKFPDTTSGIAWVDDEGKPHWVSVNNTGWSVNTSDEPVVALGSAAGFFDTTYLSTNDVMAAVLSALEKDPLSSTDVVDIWDRHENVINTHVFKNGATTPTLEELIAGGQPPRG